MSNYVIVPGQARGGLVDFFITVRSTTIVVPAPSDVEARKFAEAWDAKIPLYYDAYEQLDWYHGLEEEAKRKGLTWDQMVKQGQVYEQYRPALDAYIKARNQANYVLNAFVGQYPS